MPMALRVAAPVKELPVLLVATADADTVAGPTNNTVPRLMAPAAVTVAPVADKVPEANLTLVPSVETVADAGAVMVPTATFCATTDTVALPAFNTVPPRVADADIVAVIAPVMFTVGLNVADGVAVTDAEADSDADAVTKTFDSLTSNGGPHFS